MLDQIKTEVENMIDRVRQSDRRRARCRHTGLPVRVDGHDDVIWLTAAAILPAVSP